VTRFPTTPATSPADEARRAEILADPGFGRYFTDHVALADWSGDGTDWHGDRVVPLADLSLHPASSVLHYGQSIFEGLKAYRHADGSVWLFRPDRNAARFRGSARRLALPELPDAWFTDSLAALVRTDAAWVPEPSEGGEQSLYLRPTMFASEPFLGVRPAASASYVLLASPAGPYFADGIHGVRLWVSHTHVRATPGGTGAAKCGGNYAASLVAQTEAQQHGCDQVLWLDGAERRWVEESGTMNVCVVTADGELVTPESETILDGVTRDSILPLAAEHGLVARQRPLSLTELLDRTDDGSITEVFACGTAAVITPVTAIRDGDRDHVVADGEPGERSLALRQHLLDLQYGRRPDPYGWLRRIC